MAQINIDAINLIIFGDYGVLTNTPFKDRQPLHMLPGRVQYLAWLRQDRAGRGLPTLFYEVAANKGGAAWGKHTEDEGHAEVRRTVEWIAGDGYAICFGCPTCAVGFERYTTPDMLARRKPETAMFQELADSVGVAPGRVLIVDHYADGGRAARELGMAWQSPARFFAYAQHYQASGPDERMHQIVDELDLLDIDAVLVAQEQQQQQEED